jgi:catecholate siderophore receptor
MISFRHCFLGMASLGYLTGLPSGFAEEAEERTLDQIIVVGDYLYADTVNALKTPTPVIDVPQSLSIVTADDILERGFDSVSDIVNYTPGVNNSQGEGHRDAIVFRGVRSTADFFVDGVRDDVQYYRSLYNLEQVEILRGPNALLFGRGGTGGILNRVTKKASLDDVFTAYQVNVDSFGGGGGQIDSNRIWSDTAGFRVNAYYEGLRNHRDFYQGRNYGLNPTARLILAPTTTLDVSYEYADHERFIDRGIPTGSNGRPVEGFKRIVFGDPDLNTAEFEAHILNANLQTKFSENLKSVFTVSFGDYDKLYQNFYASGYNQVVTPGRVTLDGYVDTTKRRRISLSGNLVGRFDTGSISQTLIGGAEYLDTRNDNDRYNARWSSNGFTDDNETFLITRPLALNGGRGVNIDGVSTQNDFFVPGSLNDRTESSVEVFSVFVQDQIEVSSSLDIVLGLRFDSFYQSTMNLQDLTVPQSADRRDTQLSPRLGVIYKPQDNVSVYGSYSEAFLPRSGEQYASTGSLDPDEFEQTEIGLKWDLSAGLSFTAAYFRNNQTRADRDDQTGEAFEVRGLDIEGFELQLQGDVTDRLFLAAGYSYLSGKTENGAERPRELPENTASFWGAYQLTEKFSVGLGVTYQDDSFITDYKIGQNGPHPTLPAYVRIDAAAYYNISDKLRVQFNFENLTNQLYFPTSHSIHQVSVGAPLLAKLTLSGRF